MHAKSITTALLEIACEDSGPRDAPAVVLLHGFPYDPRCYDEVVTHLHAAGLRTIVPWLRGYGATRFRSTATMRSGQQAAIGHDLLDLIEAMGLERPLVAGFDWGGRAACVVAALRPDKVSGLVTCCGYQVQDIAAAPTPASPEQEARFWYQHYFQTERGRAGLASSRDELCRLLWKMWSPTWAFDDAVWNKSAPSFHHPDFVEVVIHSYRHRMGNAPGDPRYGDTEARLAALPPIGVPAISVHGDSDGVNPPATSAHQAHQFTASYERRVFEGIGHNPPQEAPREFAQAVIDVWKAAAAD